jgi:hypothetical protein
VLIRPRKIIFEKIKYSKISKNAEFYADFRTVEKVAKNAHTKSSKETYLMNMSKSGKSKFFHHSFVNNLLCVIFFNVVNSFEIGIKFCVFDIFFDFFQKENFIAKSAQIGSK